MLVGVNDRFSSARSGYVTAATTGLSFKEEGRVVGVVDSACRVDGVDDVDVAPGYMVGGIDDGDCVSE